MNKTIVNYLDLITDVVHQTRVLGLSFVHRFPLFKEITENIVMSVIRYLEMNRISVLNKEMICR